MGPLREHVQKSLFWCGWEASAYQKVSSANQELHQVLQFLVSSRYS